MSALAGAPAGEAVKGAGGRGLGAAGTLLAPPRRLATRLWGGTGGGAVGWDADAQGASGAPGGGAPIKADGGAKHEAGGSSGVTAAGARHVGRSSVGKLPKGAKGTGRGPQGMPVAGWGCVAGAGGADAGVDMQATLACCAASRPASSAILFLQVAHGTRQEKFIMRWVQLSIPCRQRMGCTKGEQAYALGPACPAMQHSGLTGEPKEGSLCSRCRPKN